MPLEYRFIEVDPSLEVDLLDLNALAVDGWRVEMRVGEKMVFKPLYEPYSIPRFLLSRRREDDPINAQ